MTVTQMRSQATVELPKAPAVDLNLEVVVIPVLDVDRAKNFYAGLGWRLDADYASGDNYRVIQFTPLGSGCSIIFGKNVTAAARKELLGRGVAISEVFHDAGGVYTGADRSS